MIKRSLPSQKPRAQQMSTQDGRNPTQLYPEQDQPDRPGNPGPGQGPDDLDKNAPSREVRARYGVDPEQVPDFIALRGDPSDKVPGAPGVGATGAATLLQRYGSLEAALTAGRFPVMAESLRLFRSIATMNRKAPLPNLRSQKPTWDKAAALAREWELNQLARRLKEFGSLGDG